MYFASCTVYCPDQQMHSVCVCVCVCVYIYIYIYIYTGGQDSVVGIATLYRLDGPGNESWWGQDLSHLSRPALGLTQPPIQWVPGLFSGGKAAEAWS